MAGVQPFLRNFLGSVVYFLVKFTKRLFMMPEGTCRFRPTCSCYAKEAISTLPLHKALPKIISRVSRCHPRGSFGYDPVHPDQEEPIHE